MTLKRTSFGATTMAIASALRVGVQIIILPIIGRILGPHAYGLIALVSPFIFFSMLLAESGLGACIVRAETVTPELEGTVFCFSASLGLVFIAIFAALAWPLGALLGEPAFPALLIGMSSILLLAAFNIVPGSLLLRNKKYNWIAGSDVASSVGGLAGVMLGIALGWGVWSLVAQQITLWLCKIAVVTIGSRSWPKLIFRRSVIRENIHFGSNLTGASIMAFIARNIDNVLIGRFMGALVLGYYALAFQIVSIPQMILSGSVYFTVFSDTSEAKRSGVSSAAKFLVVLRGVTLICAPAIAGLAVTAKYTVPLFLGDKWGPTVRLIILLAPLGVAQTLGAAMAGVINGLGRADIMFRIGLVSSGATILAIMAGVLIGSDAVAVGVSLTALLFPLLALRTIKRECNLGYAELLKTIAMPVAAACLMALCVLALQHFLPLGVPVALKFAVSVVVGILSYGTILTFLFRDGLAQNISQMKLALQRRGETPPGPAVIAYETASLRTSPADAGVTDENPVLQG